MCLFMINICFNCEIEYVKCDAHECCYQLNEFH